MTAFLLAAICVVDPSVWTKISPAPTPLAAQIQAEVGKAKARNLTPFVYIGAGWCRPCVAIKRHRKHPKMLDAFKGTYIVELVLDDWKQADFEELRYRSDAIPFFYEIDARGRATGRMMSSEAWGDDTPENMAPMLKKFFTAAAR